MLRVRAAGTRSRDRRSVLAMLGRLSWDPWYCESERERVRESVCV